MRKRSSLLAVMLAVFLLASCNPQDAQQKLEEETQQGSEEQADQAKSASIEDFGSLGSAARPLLRPKPFTEIAVEIAFASGRDPSEGAVSHLKSILGDVTGKPIKVVTHEILAGDGSYSADEIRDLSRQRQASSSTPTAALWIGYLDGTSSDNEDALGIAVAATVAAIFPDQIGTLSTLLQPAGVERAVLVHEVGHLLGLVNIGYKSTINHEDPEHSGHSNNQSSVMFWAVETLAVRDIFRGGPPDDFDDADREDLRSLAA